MSSGLLRDFDTQQKYNNHKEKHKNIDRYIKEKYLLNNDIKLTKNSFPYFIPKNSLHFLVWSKNKLSKDELISFIEKNKKAWNFDKYIFFENSEEKKTVKTVIHYHIITC